jgi:dihydrofolate synthase/folylpolyglutamate synthase
VTTDEIFFREWRERGPGEERSIKRAGRLVRRLALDRTDVPIVTIVGSKGKGTAATYASAYLAANGMRVVTVTSPSYRSNRERIRVCGQAVTAADLADLASVIEEQVGALPPRSQDGGYLSPVGLFTVAGMLHARSIDADVIVLEAGRGGRSDEVSLFPPTVVGLTSIFAEHLGQIGRSVAAIAADKAGSVAAETRVVVSLPQSPGVWRTVTKTIAARTEGRLEPVVVPPLSVGIPVGLLASGLGQANSELGISAAQRLLDVTTHARPEAEDLIPILTSVNLPGRLSWHRVPGGSTEILADSAINRAGVAVAMTTARERWDTIDNVLLCLPDHKDLPGAIAELSDVPVTFGRLPDQHLRFTRRLPAGWDVIEADELTRDMLAAFGQRVVALGTVYFIGRILDLVDADTDRLFTPGSHMEQIGK